VYKVESGEGETRILIASGKNEYCSMVNELRNYIRAMSPYTRIFALLLIQCLPFVLVGQQTVLYRDAEADFTSMVKEYEQGLFGRCIRSADRFRTIYQDPVFEQFAVEAELLKLKAGLNSRQPGIIDEVFAFSALHKPDPVAEQAVLLIGEDAYDRREYEEAIKYLSMVDSDALQPEEQSALHFKLGYVLFVRKEFDRAAALFARSKENRDKYYYPSNYYYGMTQYFQGNFPEAIRSFERVAPSSFYKDYIPYYITQIYFSTREFQKVIGYGNQAINNPSVLNKTEIRQLIGQAYFETGDYAAAIPHLEYVEQQTDKLRTDDFYQLGMAYYNTGKYAEAIPVLAQIRNETGVKAHYANYYLGQCYLKTGDKVSARNSMMNASNMQDVPALATESTFHYGRLSAEAGDDVEAIRVLQTIPSTSPEYADAQTTLAGILTNTSDYSLAISQLESMKSLSPALKGALQKVCLYRAEQLIQEGKVSDALPLLDRSLQNPVDKIIEARAYFWKGELAHHSGSYNESIKWFNQYFLAAGKSTGLPPYQSQAVARYTQGYNYLRNANYTEAQSLLEEAVQEISAMPMVPGEANLIRKQVYPDAILRAGDCAFKRNQYDKAIFYYDQSIQSAMPGSDYAEFQKAIITGLKGQPKEKIRQLEGLVKTKPESMWADDALFQAGNTYQDEGQTDKAIQSYEKIVKEYKQNSPLLMPALLRLGLVSYNSGKFDASLTYYKSVFQYNPDPETSREAMAAIQEIYVNEQDKPDAYFAFAESIPGYSVSGSAKDSILYNAAENFYGQGQYEKAAESFLKYTVEFPKGLYTLKAKYLRAESLSLVKKYDDALTAYEAVIDQGQSIYFATSLYKAALISYNQKQDFVRAYKHYTTFIPLADSEEKTYEASLGALRSAHKLGQAQDVNTMADKVIAHPRATDDVRALAYSYKAAIASQANELDNALMANNAIIRINSADLAAEARYNIALIYEMKGEHEVAVKLSEEAARANVGYPFWVAKSLILLSDIQFNAGDLLNARAVLEAITENFQGDDVIMTEAATKLERIKQEEEHQSRIKPVGGDTLELQQNPKKD
jgi:tetratricopeptide (TPR) repeat protein